MIKKNDEVAFAQGSKDQAQIGIDEALQRKEALIVDVRTPLEYAEDHIPGAVNIPLLENEERVFIGTLYKREGKTEAVSKGLELVTPKLTRFYQEFSSLAAKYAALIIYCYRGGMRSGSITHYLLATGINNILKLEGGYKSYRRFVLDSFDGQDEKMKFVILHGHTGVGKTQMLLRLKELGASIVDLEELAKHSGSAFGTLFFKENPPSQKMFESLMAKELREAKEHGSSWVFMESESKKIGHRSIPSGFWDKMLRGHHILVQSSIENRVKRLVEDYTSREWETDQHLTTSIDRLLRELGRKNVVQLHKWREEKDYDSIADFLIRYYYDPLYQHSIEKYQYDFQVCSDEFEKGIRDILQKFPVESSGEINEK